MPPVFFIFHRLSNHDVYRSWFDDSPRRFFNHFFHLQPKFRVNGLSSSLIFLWSEYEQISLISVFATYITLNVPPIHIGIEVWSICWSTARISSLALSPHLEPIAAPFPFPWIFEEALDKVHLQQGLWNEKETKKGHQPEQLYTESLQSPEQYSSSARRQSCLGSGWSRGPLHFGSLTGTASLSGKEYAS